MRLLPGGEALVHPENRPGAPSWLAANAVPGDVLRLTPCGKRRGVMRARVREVVSPSPLRAAPVCEAADACGGCALAFVDAGAHAGIKSAWVREAFAAHLTETCDWRGVTGEPTLATRRRARLWRGEDAQGSFLGFRARASHRVVRSAHCPVIHPFIESVRRSLGPRLPRAVSCVRATVLTDGAHVVLEGTDRALPETLARWVEEMAGELDFEAPVAWWVRIGNALQPLSRPVPRINERVPAGEGEVMLPVGPEDFVQGTMGGHAALVAQVSAWTQLLMRKRRGGGGAFRVADLFCGIGNLSLPLVVALGCTVRGADACAASIRQANRAVRELRASGMQGVDARYETLNLFEPFDAAPFAGADVLLLDPPRKGARLVCERLGELLPRAIIMVHCDPAAGRRDAGIVAGCGYRLRALRALDLFPWTGHVESLSLWTR